MGNKRKRKHSSSSSSTSDSDSDSSSDSSPDKQPKRAESRSIGPQIPQGVNIRKEESFIGPAIPEHLKQEDEDEDCIGPMPFSGDAEDLKYSAVEEFERRAQKMKSKMMGESAPETSNREQWMMELPEINKNFGVGPRTFRKGAGGFSDADRSGWTDTPADRERRAQDEAEGKGAKPIPVDVFQSQRDKIMAEQVAEHNKSGREESLLELHRKKLEKKKKKAEKKAKKKAKKESKKKKKKDKEKEKKKKKAAAPPPPERRPFDRDADLAVNRFDNARRNALIKKSAELGSRFKGGGTQFL